MSHFAPSVANVGIDVVAIGTANPKSGTADKIARFFAEDFPSQHVKPYYGETVWKEILAKHKPDVLFVATPDHLHAQPILDALDAGCDVITEKPLCLTTAEADAIVARGRSAQRIVSVDMHKRYDPFVREMMGKAREKYGQINRVRAVLEEPLEVSTEIFAWAQNSNPFAYVGCHWLDVVHHYLGVKPRAVFATGQKNLLLNWDKHVVEIAKRKGRPVDTFKKRHAIETWDSLDVAVTYDDGMRGDYNNNWINPAEFEGAVNQEIEVYGIYGRGFVDQQDRGFRETVTGDGTRTRNPTFGGRIRHAGGNTEVFGYGKASIVSGMLAIMRRRFLGESAAALEATYPAAISQRDVVRIIEAAGIVAQRNYDAFAAGKGTPVSARLDEKAIEIIEPR
ncbi:MAG: Gfo/Idh/MocA family oxidoreductase [Planctomycetota bacterium]|nr:Gfo/Idh/MocA family oxidoreductase [Planctomycetota bacterium]